MAATSFHQRFESHLSSVNPIHHWLLSKVGTNDVKFEDPEAFEAAIKAVRSDVNFADWCLVGYKAEKTLGVIGGGRGGLDALLDAAEPSSVNYGLLRVRIVRCAVV